MSVIAAALLLVQPVAAPAVSATPPLPADWSTLDELPLHRRWSGSAAITAFVRDEVTSGRCQAATAGPGGQTLRIELAILIGTAGQIRRIVPRAIDCVAVEQYAAGLLLRLARDNVVTTGIVGETWFRAAFTFGWAE